MKNFGDPRNWEAYKKGRKNAVEFVKDVFNAPFNLLGTKFLHGELTAAGLLHLNISKVIQIFDKNRSEPFERPEVLPLLVDTFFNEKELSQLAQWREEAKVLKSQLTRKFWSSGSNK